ncbi:hypothetical protein [Noviherbaspirillum pedocola]|uniref:Uncharacterized protein n=1 Tax=Noviherbaspirillum pedocola TaxID=2801341 RepID=A0A934SVF4_9BURK|nr:hypothetical protein [Noviherbaspirillum pedocola]MBK4736145.1 hypothetical protein [Noviherbaspirillum pedocola]
MPASSFIDTFIAATISGISCGSLAVALLFFVARKYLSAYTGQKGKNLADKEDLHRLTEIVESVKTQNAAQLQALTHQFNVLLEEHKTSNQMRLAALDKRLEAHQKAFALWRKILPAANTDEIGKVVMECQEWWENNCLYLEPEARDAFSRAYHAAGIHRQLFQGRAAPADIIDNWKAISEAADILMRAVALPPLSSEIKQEMGDVPKINESGA